MYNNISKRWQVLIPYQIWTYFKEYNAAVAAARGKNLP